MNLIYRSMLAAVVTLSIAGCNSSRVAGLLERSREAAGEHAKHEATRLIDKLLPASSPVESVADEAPDDGTEDVEAVSASTEPEIDSPEGDARESAGPAAEIEEGDLDDEAQSAEASADESDDDSDPPARGSLEKREPKVPPAAPCTIVENPALKGRAGRILVAYPQGSRVGTWAKVWKDEKEIYSGTGSQTWEMMPGRYTVFVCGLRIEGIEVRSRCDTKVMVGVLRVILNSSPWVHVHRAGESDPVTYWSGSGEIGLPPGKYDVAISGTREAVEVRAGEITEY